MSLLWAKIFTIWMALDTSHQVPRVYNLPGPNLPHLSRNKPLHRGHHKIFIRTSLPTDWSPFESEIQFRTADFLYCRVEMSAGNIDELLELWALDKMKSDQLGPFTSYEHMYSSIDAIQLGDAPWKCFTPSDPSWKSAEYEVWFQDPEVIMTQMLDNPEFDGHFDYAPYIGLDKSGKRRWSDFMSGNYAWHHSDKIYEEDPTTEGALYCPIIAGSDKTTVSVATGHVEYHPFYISGGNLFNTVCRAHRNAVAPAGFLAIPKGDRKYDNDPAFRKFKRQLYHDSIAAILKTFRPGMIKPVVRRCPDGHFQHVIYDLAAYIADYPEQVYLAGIVQNWCPKCTALPTNLDGLADSRSRRFTEGLVNELDLKRLWDEYGIDDDITPFTFHFPRADIHEMLSADLLHQLIKVQWVGDYLYLEHGKARANEILDDIDRRIAAAPLLSGLRRFPHGRRFKQWTGDDSKALMKVYLPAISGYVPPEMVQCISAFLDACYIARRADITQESLAALQTAIERFHTHREIFRTCGVQPTGFNLPQQHSLVHLIHQIQEFGAPGGLCSSITESHHITAVKRPWRRSNRYEGLGQMLLTNQRLDKLLRARTDFVERRMLPPSHLPPPKPIIPLGDDDEDTGIIDEYVTGNVALARTRNFFVFGKQLKRAKPHKRRQTMCYLADGEEGFIRYQGQNPREGIQNAADRLTEIWDEEKEKYVSIPEGYTAPHDPQDYIDALNWEIAEAETTCHAELASATQRAKRRGGEDWEAPDPMIESDLSGSDYEETQRDKETERARLRSRGKPATDTEEEDEEEDREMQRELQEEMNSKASGRSKGLAAAQSKRTSSDNKKTSPNPTISPPAGISWDALKASLSPSELNASAVLRSFNLNLMPEELIPKVDTVSSQKPSLMESALYRLFGRIVWQYTARLGHLNSCSPDFVMEKANLLQKEKRAPNHYNVFKTFASRSKPDDDDHEGLQTWNKNLNEEYRKLMEGADTSEEKDERMAEAFKFVKEQIADEGTSIHDASLRFAEHLKTITDMITTIKRRDHSFDVAGILVYSGKNRTARNKSGLFMSSPELRELCSNEQWPISTITDIFVTKVRVMHAD
ncbi:uncharacterized protein LACBIDRAFT_333636 [Laccaria bicolor S238N-H82]|uniref:Predicted protein n=1 Tax=Laccaria bicolor (strain S238N-H82 / ATCC MYA-4686) TaxID=486041 RepID=B0DWQ5_LACBS|nr:uncharacterized protein LACBIDRAFT_333636 [Laccaria bicolor S238N-H82]EDR00932.1 predicted protein [Laccaria bicolor S238N-H82]|eukprot:XP_001888327.1 predicted protein [Laccaria bicolor S238N-H82]